MHFRKLVFSVLAVFAIGQMASAQVQRCITPQIRDGEAFENWLSEVRSARSIQRLAATTYNIPVIVHIIHDGETIGQGDNISLDQVISQFVVLNADFTRTNADASETPAEFLPVAAGMDISFVPAIVNEAGDTLAEPGVHRVNRNGLFDPPPYNSSYIDGTIKPETFWDPDKYFNIWVLDFSEALGYAQPPVAALPDLDPSADADLDGIVVRSSVFGTFGSVSAPWDKGRVTTHEAGHWLGLYHLWGQSNNNACGEDDYVADTPNQDEPSQFCGVQNDYCTGVTLEMSENYMDYTWDACMNLFTIGQVDRMTTVVENAPRRNTLLVSNTGGKFDQQITFSTLQEYTYGDDAFALTAFSGSGLPVLYSSSNESVATVTGSNITIIGAGSTVITASQVGNFLFNEASVVQQTLVVNKADQTITFEPIPIHTFGDADFKMTASASSGLQTEFASLDTTIVKVYGDTLSIISAGNVMIEASQQGNANYNPALPVSQLIEIQKADQVVILDSLPELTYGDPNFNLHAESDVGLTAMTFSSSDTTIIAISDSSATITGTGQVNIIAIQEGNVNYNLATDTLTVTVAKASQNWFVSGAQDYQDTLSTIPLVIKTDSELDPDYTIDLPILAYDGMWTVQGTGKVIIMANQNGNELYNSADTTLTFCLLPSPVIFKDTINYEIILYTDYTEGILWTFPNDSVSQNDSIIVDQIGVYTLDVLTNGCPVSTTENQVDMLVPVQDLFPGLSISLYPNPASNKLVIEIMGERPLSGFYAIQDLLGKQVVGYHQLNFSTQKIDINHLIPGVYFLQLIVNERPFTIRFVKE